MKESAIADSLKLVENSKIVMLGTNASEGFPHIKAMLNLKHEGLKKIWLSTNTSSKRVQRLKEDKRACLYYVDEEDFKGLMLIGSIEILQDKESRELLWFPGCERYYPLGVDDPDYTVLCFTATQGNYYHRLTNVDFQVV